MSNANRREICAPRQHLARAMQRCETCFVLVEGLLLRESMLADGSRQIVGLNVPGDVCGLTSWSSGRSDHDLIALSPVSYVPVAHDRLSALAEQSTALSRAMWQEISREMAIAAAWIANFGQRPAYKRIAHFFCELEARLYAAGHDTSAGIEWPGNQADLGAATGLSLVHVNRTMQRLQADQVITGRRHVRIRDIEKLRDIAGFDPSYLVVGHGRLGEMLLSHAGVARRSVEAGQDFAYPARQSTGEARSQ